MLTVKSHRAANAGGYCAKEGGRNPTRRVVWFTDEMTPRYDWTFAVNFLAALSIRFHCKLNCRCSGTAPPVSNPATGTFWQVLAQAVVSQQSDGSISFRGYSPLAGRTVIRQILPPQGQGPENFHRAGTCGTDGRQFCEEPWPAVFGPPPGPTPPPVKISGDSEGPRQCGNVCSGPLDCSSSDPTAGCFCAVPSPMDAERLGLPPTTPGKVGAVCLAFAGISHTSDLNGKRDLGLIDSQGNPYRCLCNETHFAAECC